MTPRHRRRLGVLVGIALLSAPLLSTAGSASPLDDKKAEAARIAAQLEAQGERLSDLDEQYNRAVLKLQDTEAALARSERDIASANTRYAAARTRLSRHAVNAYVHGGSTSVVEHLAQSDGADLTLRNQYLETAAAEERDAIGALKAAREDLERLRERLDKARSEQKAAADVVADNRREIQAANDALEATYGRVRGELAQMIAAEQARQDAEARRRAQATLSARQAAQSRGATRASPPGAPTTAPPVGSGAAHAVAVARAQIGKPYQWAASGPDSFDCSGLTMYAWRAAGVSLPHSTYAQWDATTHIPMSALQPGDLVFFRNLNHMAIYSGNGMMIEAPHTGAFVRERSLRTHDFYGASRPGSQQFPRVHGVTIVNGTVEWRVHSDPTPGTGELLVAVRAAGLNGADMMQRQGLYPAPPGAPTDIPGLELAGEVIEVGPGVQSYRAGDRVMAVVGGGAQAELAVVHERTALPVPNGITWEAAGGFPEVFTTAHDALFTQCGLLMGERLLVHGAAGGVGTAGVQLGVLAGAQVTATVRNPVLLDAVAKFGAVAVAPDAFAAHGPFDVVLELVGAPNLPANLDALAVGGRIAVIGVGAGAVAELNLFSLMGKRARIHGSTLRARPLEQKADAARRVEAHVLPLLRDRRVTVPIATTFSMADAAAAYDHFSAGGKFGKVVLLTG